MKKFVPIDENTLVEEEINRSQEVYNKFQRGVLDHNGYMDAIQKISADMDLKLEKQNAFKAICSNLEGYSKYAEKANVKSYFVGYLSVDNGKMIEWLKECVSLYYPQYSGTLEKILLLR